MAGMYNLGFIPVLHAGSDVLNGINDLKFLLKVQVISLFAT